MNEYNSAITKSASQLLLLGVFVRQLVLLQVGQETGLRVEEFEVLRVGAGGGVVVVEGTGVGTADVGVVDGVLQFYQ